MITTNIKEYFASANKNSITGFRLFNPIILMEYIQTNYRTVLPKQLHYNGIALDSKWDPTTHIVALFTRIEDCKPFFKAREETFTENNILISAYLAIKDTELFNLPCHTLWDNPTSAKNWSDFKLFFTKESANNKHHITGLVGLNDESSNYILQLRDEFSAQQK